MTTAKIKQPDLVQAFDVYKDREYYKIQKGFLFSSEILIRKDRLEEFTEWQIKCEKLPDVIWIGGKRYKLIKEI